MAKYSAEKWVEGKVNQFLSNSSKINKPYYGRAARYQT